MVKFLSSLSEHEQRDLLNTNMHKTNPNMHKKPSYNMSKIIDTNNMAESH